MLAIKFINITMDKKSILIYTDAENFDNNEGDFLDNYINSNFGEYVVIMCEDNKGVLMNEEEDAFMVMEYV